MVIYLLILSLVISIDCLGGPVHAGRLCIRPSTADWHRELRSLSLPLPRSDIGLILYV